MAIYKIRITETLVKDVSIDAENKKEAIMLANKLYEDGTIVLNADDFNGDYTIEYME